MFPWRSKPTEMETLFEALDSRDGVRRYQALMDAQALTSGQLEELVRIAERGNKRSSSRCLAPFLIGAALIDGIFLSSTAFDLSAVFVIFGLLVAIYLFISGPEWPRMHWYQENILRILENAPDGRGTASVLYMLGSAKVKRWDRLHKILLKQLPMIRAEDVREWTFRQKEPIKLVLRSWQQHEELAHCILKAMPEIGGVWALGSVERLAKLERWEPEHIRANYRKLRLQELPWQARNKDDMQPTQIEIDAVVAVFRRIGEAAAVCLPLLRERIRGEEAAKVLLRAAGAGNSPDELLRPAGNKGVGSDTANLLRPGAQSEEGALTDR